MTPQVMLYQLYKLIEDERGDSEPSKEVEDILGKLPRELVRLAFHLNVNIHCTLYNVNVNGQTCFLPQCHCTLYMYVTENFSLSIV